MTFAPVQLFRFAWVQAQCCLFAAAVFVGLALSNLVPLPTARYDALLAYALVLTAVFYLLHLETGREVAVIFAFHLIGLALELFKVQVGSWSYPEPAWAKVAGVPLYSGFMYAAVGSYLCQAFRRFDLRVENFAWAPAVTLAVAAYANFFTHHYLPDLRWAVAVGFLVVLWRSRVSYTVGQRRYAMPLSLSFVLIGFFLWVAENAATLLGAWQYPDQEQVWQMVHVGKWGSWALLVSLSFVLVAGVKMQEGRFYGAVGAVPTVTGSSPAGLRPGNVAAREVAATSGRPGFGHGLAVEGDRTGHEQDTDDLGGAGQLDEHEHAADGRRGG